MVTYTARIQRRKTTITLSIWFGSALVGYPALSTAAVISFWKAALRVLNSAGGSWRPGKLCTSTLEPMRALAIVPAGAASLRYEIARLARKLFTRSHDVVNCVLPIGSN